MGAVDIEPLSGEYGVCVPAVPGMGGWLEVAE